MPDLKTEIEAKLLNPASPAKEDTSDKRVNARLSCAPVHAARLAKEVGSLTEAGRLIGMSSSGIGMAITRGVIGLTAEIAAQGVLAQMDAKKGRKDSDREVVLMARVPPSKKQALIVVAEALGIAFKEV